MKKVSGLLAFLGAFLLFSSLTAHAQLINYDTNIFQDTTSGLYWYQPGYFLGDTRAEIDAFLATPGNSNWRLATYDDLWQLMLNNSYYNATGIPMSTYLGERMDTWWYTPDITYNYWNGHYDYGDSTYHYVRLSERTDYIGGFFTLGLSIDPFGDLNGAWVCSETAPSNAPVPEPATLILLGAGLFGLAGFKKKIRG